jgi:serine/threonine protein kinase
VQTTPVPQLPCGCPTVSGYVRVMAAESDLARYLEIATLGAGGMARVVLAEDRVLGRLVALKRLRASAGDARGLVRFRREALIGASLTHGNLVSIYDVIDSEDDEAVIVMEYVRGTTLRSSLNDHGPMSPREALRVLSGLAAALDAIHARGIVHRDVKPENVLLGVEGTVKLADLGIASVPDHTRITTVGTVLGSFRYMAPEQLKEGRATYAIDIYALAAVAFEMLSGRQARREPNPLALAHAISTQPPPDLRDAWPSAPADAANVLIDGMCRDPSGRPSTATELVSRLKVAFEPDDTAAMAPVRRSPVPSAAAAAALLPEKGGAAGARPAGGEQARRPSDARALAPRPESGALSEKPRNGQQAVLRSGDSGPNRKTFRASRHPSLRRVLAPLALLVVVGAVILAALSAGRPSSTRSGPPASRVRASHSRFGPGAGSGSTSTRSKAAAGNGSGQSASSTPPASSAPSGAAVGAGSVPAASASSSWAPTGAAPSGPVAAVEAFYELAAAHRYSQAWALADPTFRNQLQGYDSFQAGQADDRSITFDTAEVARQSGHSATVYVRTTSVRTDGTQHCEGTVELVTGGQSAAWLLHTISINCT